MKPKFIPLLQQCIEDGVCRGYVRAHKHTDAPDEQHLKDQIIDAVMFEIYEWFDFDEITK